MVSPGGLWLFCTVITYLPCIVISGISVKTVLYILTDQNTVLLSIQEVYHVIGGCCGFSLTKHTVNSLCYRGAHTFVQIKKSLTFHWHFPDLNKFFSYTLVQFFSKMHNDHCQTFYCLIIELSIKYKYNRNNKISRFFWKFSAVSDRIWISWLFPDLKKTAIPDFSLTIGPLTCVRQSYFSYINAL